MASHHITQTESLSQSTFYTVYLFAVWLAHSLALVICCQSVCKINEKGAFHARANRSVPRPTEGVADASGGGGGGSG